jgi:hypothetical protein
MFQALHLCIPLGAGCSYWNIMEMTNLGEAEEKLFDLFSRPFYGGKM